MFQKLSVFCAVGLVVLFAAQAQASLTFSDGKDNPFTVSGNGWVSQGFTESGSTFTCTVSDGGNKYQLPCYRGEDNWFKCDGYGWDVNCDSQDHCVAKCTAQTPEPASVLTWGLLAGAAGAAALRRRQRAGRWSKKNRAAILEVISQK